MNTDRKPQLHIMIRADYIAEDRYTEFENRVDANPRDKFVWVHLPDFEDIDPTVEAIKPHYPNYEIKRHFIVKPLQ